MTTPFPFVAAQVLTANELNSITNLPSSTKTVSYTLVASDAGKRIVMNSASSTTITVNTSLFTAGDVVELSNIAVGVCTVTAGTATVSSAGPLAIPQYGGGRLVFTSASAAIYFPSAVTVAAPAASGLTFITRQTFSAVTSFSLTNVFSSTYTNYLIQVTGLFSASNGSNLSWRVGSSGSAYTGSDYNQASLRFAGGADASSETLNTDKWPAVAAYLSSSSSALSSMNSVLFNPNTTARTTMVSQTGGARDAPLSSQQTVGTLNTATQYTDLFYINTDSSNTSGIVTVYGYANS
jgi:hypothetical protein